MHRELPCSRRQGLQEGHQIDLLQPGQAQRPHFGIAIRVASSTGIVEVDDCFKRLKAPVVHVWRGQMQLPQRWRLECSSVLWAACDSMTSQIRRAPGDAADVELLVAEVWTGVTRGAIGSPAEQSEAARGGLGESVVVARAVSIARCIASALRAHVARERLRHTGGRRWLRLVTDQSALHQREGIWLGRRGRAVA